MIQVPAGEGARVLSIAGDFDAVNSATWSASDSDGRGVEVAVLHVSNAAVGPLVDALEAIPELRVSLIPSGALALRLLVALYVQRQDGGGTSDELLQQRVVTAAREAILREEPRLAPLIAVTVLSP